MSCSGQIVAENDLLQIEPAVTKKLKKAKYGIADHSTVEVVFCNNFSRTAHDKSSIGILLNDS